MRNKRTVTTGALLLALLAATVTAVTGDRLADGPPYAPADSMRTLQVEPGYTVSLVAGEPDVQSPVAIDIDESGRMFVVEMPGYPLDTRPTGRIRQLEDRDGDGRFETSRVFAEGLVLPTGVMRWKRGVLVTAAPDLIYLEDRNDDGRADAKHVVLTGFAFTNPQHTVNGPLYGADNWIYLAHEGPAEPVIYKDLFGDRGRPLTWPAHPERAPLEPRGRGIRLRPDEGLAETLSSGSQYGHAFDRWGHYFTNDNSNHARHEVIAARHLARNPHLRIQSAMQDVSDHGSAAQVFPITKRPTFELLTESGQFTSACAITVYDGGLFAPPAEPSAAWLFSAEPVHNLVHRDVLQPAGATFSARQSHASREFLAAGDSWFRPVFLYTAPDGALYVVDYYRGRIEHPEWGATDAQKDPSSLYAGQDRGRIYRIAPSEPAAARRRVALGSASDEALVAELSNPNAWWRRTAQRLLVDRRAAGATAALRAVLGGTSAVGRFHALWTLEALGRLDDDALRVAMGDGVAGVREAAIAIAEARLSRAPSLLEPLIALERDPEPRVRFAVLAALGSADDERAATVRERMLMASIDDRWVQVAALSARSVRAEALLSSAIARGSTVLASSTPGRAAFLEQVASMVARGADERALRAALEGVGIPWTEAWRTSAARSPDATWWRVAVLRGLLAGARGNDGARQALGRLGDPVLALYGDPSADVRRAAIDLLAASIGPRSVGWAAMVAWAGRMAAHRDGEPAARADALALVSLDRPASRVPLFERLLSPREPEVVQLEAVRALGRVPAGPASGAIGRTLLARWDGMTPAVRSAAADVLIADPARLQLLLEAMRAGRVQAWTLDFWQKRDLVMHDDPKVRAASRALLEEDPRQRAATIRRYATALDLAGDAARGREVFARACAACHRLGTDAGGDLGPDLATVRHRPPLGLLGDILVPSQSIAQHYETYVVRRNDGTTEAGVLGAQTADSITLRQGLGREVSISRADIRSLSAAPQSSMPADLDKVVSPEEMADLLAYIRGG